jgi:hypothetical protein
MTQQSLRPGVVGRATTIIHLVVVWRRFWHSSKKKAQNTKKNSSIKPIVMVSATPYNFFHQKRGKNTCPSDRNSLMQFRVLGQKKKRKKKVFCCNEPQFQFQNPQLHWQKRLLRTKKTFAKNLEFQNQKTGFKII